MLQTQRLVCASMMRPARLRRGDEPFHCTALIWRDGERALVLLVDRRERNTGASVTNAAESIIDVLLEQVLEPAGVPADNVRWVERDSVGCFDDLHIVDRQDRGIRSWRAAFRPCGARTLDSFKNMAKALGFTIDASTVGQLDAVIEDADTPATAGQR